VKRPYDFTYLATTYGFSLNDIEKVCRLSDVIEDISYVPFLRDRLSLYGGTALAFIYYQSLPRLSIDIDFNYRQVNSTEWGQVRTQIDEQVKTILAMQGYTPDQLAIQASYPLGRLDVHYTNTTGMHDRFNIEIGYLRRTPILPHDTFQPFRHIGTDERIRVKTPQPMELFANKWCVMLYRGSPRDLFDVYQISSMPIDPDVFRKCAIVDSLMRCINTNFELAPKLHEINVNKVIQAIPINSSLKNLLNQRTPYNFTRMKEDVLAFSNQIIESITDDEQQAIHHFYQTASLNTRLLSTTLFHKNLNAHPLIRRNERVLKRKQQSTRA
jgi:predicted nucleotidyltransferase component of viral defense system